MAIALATIIKAVDNGQILEVLGTLTLSGNYGTGGESLATVLKDERIKSSRAPYAVFVSDVSGYAFGWNAVTNKLMVFSAPGTELAAAGYPAALTTSNPVLFNAYFQKLL